MALIFSAMKSPNLPDKRTNEEQARDALKSTGVAVSALAPVVTGGASLPVQMLIGAGSGALGAKSMGGTNTEAAESAAVGGVLPAVLPAAGRLAARTLAPIAEATHVPVPEAAPGAAPEVLAKPQTAPIATPAEAAPEPAADPILEKLRGYAAKIAKEGHGDEIPEPDEAKPHTTNLNEDLTPALKASLRAVRAAKAARIARPIQAKPAIQ